MQIDLATRDRGLILTASQYVSVPPRFCQQTILWAFLESAKSFLSEMARPVQPLMMILHRTVFTCDSTFQCR